MSTANTAAICDGCCLDIEYVRIPLTGSYEWVHVRTGESACHPERSCGCVAEPVE